MFVVVFCRKMLTISCCIASYLIKFVLYSTVGKSQLEMFLASENGGDSFSGPKRCPNGYSQHLVTVDNQCEISYCIKTGAFQDKKLKPVKRMPFSPRPGTNPNTTEAILIVGVNGQVWYKNLTTGDWEMTDYKAVQSSGSDGEDQHSKEDKHSNGLSSGATAAISVTATTFVCILIAAAFFGLKKRRESSQKRGLLDSYVDSESRPLNPEDA